MAIFAEVKAYFRSESSYEDLTNCKPFSQMVRKHLVKVYLINFSAITSLSLGYGMNYFAKIGGLSIYSEIYRSLKWFFETPQWKEGNRFCLLMVAAFLIGASLSPMNNYVLFFTIGAASVFLWLALASKLFRGRLHIYSAGVIIAAITQLTWLLHNSYPVELCYVIVFCFFTVYVVAYSQEIDLQIRRGDTYCTHHAVALFAKSPVYFYHAIYNLIRDAEEKISREEKK